MKSPGRGAVAARLGLFPPAARADHIPASVAVQVAHAEPVRETIRAGDDLAGTAGLAHRVHFPGLRAILARREPGHLALVVLALGLPAHHQHAMAVPEQVGIERRFVAGAGPDDVRVQYPSLPLGFSYQ